MSKIKGYFFNAEYGASGYDRLYNNEDFCNYLDKIVCSGVFPDPVDQLKVVPVSGMAVTVLPGQAWIAGHKLVVYETTELTDEGTDLPVMVLSAPTNPLMVNTYYILARVNDDDRVMDIIADISMPSNFNTDKYLCLATIAVPYGTTTIDTSLITDNRGDPTLCPWVAGLIYQVDPDGIVTQYETAYKQILSDMERDFEEWFLNLQHSLSVSADLLQYRKVVTGGETVTNSIPLDMVGYTYDRKDLLHVTMNGLLLSPGYDYEITTTTDPVSITLLSLNSITAGNTLDILAIKSSLQSSADGIVTLITGDTFVHISDAIFNTELRKIDITQPIEGDNVVAITNRNLARMDIFETTVVEGITFEKTAAGKLSITGSTEDIPSYVSIPLPINTGCFIPGADYTLSINNTDLIAADNISVYVAVNGTRYAADVDIGDISFTIPSELENISLTVAVAGINREDINVELAIQLEYGGHKSAFEKNIYNEYIIDGEITPMLYDISNNIWIITPESVGLRAAYFVLNSTSSGDSIQYPLDD